MDPTTASYYRSILFRDPEDQRPLPVSLVRMHAWAFKCCQHLGIGSLISKQSALAVTMTWLASTVDGLAFARENTNIGDLLCGSEVAAEKESTASSVIVDWDSVPDQSNVLVTIEDKVASGVFLGRRGAWVDVKVGSETKAYRTSQVQIAGA